MSRINYLNIAIERERAQTSLKALRSGLTPGPLVAEVVSEYIACLDDALAECNKPPVAPLNLEKRLDAAGRYVQSVHVGMAEAPHTGWLAIVKTERIGSAEVAFARYHESPSDALDLALKDAAEWCQRQKDIR